MFEAAAFKKGGYGLRHGFLTAFVKAVVRTDLVAALIEAVTELPRNVFLNLCFADAVSRPKYGGSHRLRAFNAFGMVVGHGGRLFGEIQGLIQRAECPTDGGYAHRRSVTPAVVGLRVARLQPLKKTAAVRAFGRGICCIPIAQD